MGREEDDIGQYAEDDNFVLAEAMENAYLIATGKMTYAELEETGEFWFPALENSDTMLAPIIEYYAELEEYEICQELKDIMEERGRSNPLRLAILGRTHP
jgi:hypothetical protein